MQSNPRAGAAHQESQHQAAARQEARRQPSALGGLSFLWHTRSQGRAESERDELEGALREAEAIKTRRDREAADSFFAKVRQALEVPIDEVSQRMDMSPEAIRQAKSRISRLVRAEIERIRIEEG